MILIGCIAGMLLYVGSTCATQTMHSVSAECYLYPSPSLSFRKDVDAEGMDTQHYACDLIIHAHRPHSAQSIQSFLLSHLSGLKSQGVSN